MLLAVTRTSLLRIGSCDSVVNSICRRLSYQLTCQTVKSNVVGYVACYSKKLLEENTESICLPVIGIFSARTSSTYSTEQELTPLQFEKISNDTLDSLTEYFDELIEQAGHLTDADVSYGDGVLTVKFGSPYGTYVINRQTPNKQIWLSSPKSGPKRYDFVNGKWIYKHDGKTLHELLNNEIPAIIRNQACFDKCSFSGRERHAAMNNF